MLLYERTRTIANLYCSSNPNIVMAPRPYGMALIVVFYLLCLPCSSSSASRISLPSEPDKVSVSLYYEALCPYSASFVVNNLAKLFHSGLISIVDLNLVPWGNAKLRGNTTFSCQHGPSECFLNTIEACAINAWPTVSEHFPLIYCIEKLVHEQNFTKWESCFDELGLDSKPVDDCYTSGLGTELELGYAAETNALEPPHQYVPWVVVNGQPLYEDYENFESYICEAYSGSSAPKACAELSTNIKSTKSVEKHEVCYNKESPTILSRVREAAAQLLMRALD